MIIARVKGGYGQGTPFFPGGSGLWCGTTPFAAPPEAFPSEPTMVLAHNYNRQDRFSADSKRGGEPMAWWEGRVLPLLVKRRHRLCTCFFTNARDLRREPLGNMRATESFENSCTAFLLEQICVLAARYIVALELDAARRVKRTGASFATTPHPSAREFNPLSTRSETYCVARA